MKNSVQHVFLVGSKCFGAYGGYETFVNKLTEYHQNNKKIQYHVACKANGLGAVLPEELEGAVKSSDSEFEYHGAHCFRVKVPNVGPAEAIFYDCRSLDYVCRYIRENGLKDAIVYIMACRIGPWIASYYKKLHRMGARVFLNPDGHEWKRTKWSKPVRRYWKNSEQKMVKYCDLVVCDSVNIEKYIQKTYRGTAPGGKDPKTVFIAYGAETRSSALPDDDRRLLDWYSSKGLQPGEYYLIVGRFVPENNFETIIREFMKSNTKKHLAIITTFNQKLRDSMEERLHFSSDSRVSFVGTVYDQELLHKIRENAWGYFHGHEVGGTNPSLLEALGATRLNLLYDVGFNREVAEDSALYWTKEDGCLSALIDRVDAFDQETAEKYGAAAKRRIEEAYSWEFISNRYEEIFLN